MMKDNQRIAITKRMLQEGLLRLLEHSSIDRIKVTELCEESGINRATFYRHYTMPRDVLIELLHNMLDEMQLLSVPTSRVKDAQKSLEHICRYCFEHSRQLNILFECKLEDGFTVMLNDFYKEHLEEFRQAGQQLHVDSDALVLASHFYVGGIYYLIRRWLRDPACKTPEQIAAIIYRIVAAGSAAKDSFTLFE